MLSVLRVYFYRDGSAGEDDVVSGLYAEVFVGMISHFGEYGAGFSLVACGDDDVLFGMVADGFEVSVDLFWES